MISKNFLVFLAIGLVVVGAVIAFTWVGTKGAHLTLEGQVLKVRSVSTDEKSSIVVLDFRVTNPTKTLFMVKDGTITLTTASGREVKGDTIARADMNRVFDYYKLLGPKYNEILIMRDAIKGGEKIDRTIAATFPLTQDEIDGRKNITLQLDDIDGAEFKFTEHLTR